MHPHRETSYRSDPNKTIRLGATSVARRDQQVRVRSSLVSLPRLIPNRRQEIADVASAVGDSKGLLRHNPRKQSTPLAKGLLVVATSPRPSNLELHLRIPLQTSGISLNQSAKPYCANPNDRFQNESHPESFPELTVRVLATTNARRLQDIRPENRERLSLRWQREVEPVHRRVGIRGCSVGSSFCVCFHF